MPKLVRDDSYLKGVEEMVTEDAAVLNEVIEEDQELLAVVANPEQLIKKPYFMWTPQDKQWLAQIYASNPDVLNNFIAKKEYEQTLLIEKQLGE